MHTRFHRLSRGAIAAVFIAGTLAEAGPVIAPPNSAGTVDIPVAGHPLSNTSRLHRVSSQPLPGVTQLELDMVALTLSGPPTSVPGGGFPNGMRHTSSGTAVIVLETPEGIREQRSCPVQVVVDTPPHTTGDEQKFECQMVRLEGQLPPADPDFDLLRITGGSDFSLPCPGRATLSRLPGGNFAVDSFFDINYRIDFTGAAGGSMNGSSGATTHTDRCEQPLHVLDGALFDAGAGLDTLLTPGGLVCRTNGGGGGTAVSFGSEMWTAPDIRGARISYQPSSGGLQLPNDGNEATLGASYRGIEKSQIKRGMVVCRNVGGTCSVVPVFSHLAASVCRLELRHNGYLLDSTDVPASASAFSCPAADFHLLSFSAGNDGKDDDCDGDASDFVPSLTLRFDPAAPVMITTSGGTFSASEVRLVPINPGVSVCGVGGIDQDCDGDCVLESFSLRSFGHEINGLGEAALGGGGTAGSHWERRLPVHNLGSSGEDGVSVNLGTRSHAPLHVDIAPRNIDAQAGTTATVFSLRARDASGNTLGTCRVAGSGGGSGKVVFSDLSFISSTTARVRVFSGNTLVGEVDVALTGETQVAILTDGSDGAARISACAAGQNSPPLQRQSFTTKFDRSVVVTPSGSSAPLVGDRLEVLAADGGTGASSTGFFDIFACGPDPLVVCGVSSEPAPLASPVVRDFAAGSEPFLPLAAAIIDRYPKRLIDTTPAGLPPGSEGLEFSVELSHLVDTGVASPLGGNVFSCDLGVLVTGYGTRKGYQYYKAQSDVACVISQDPNAFSGGDVQQVKLQLRSLRCHFDLTGDPDFDLLRISIGKDGGLPPCPGQSTLTRLSEGNWRVDSSFDITCRIEFQGHGGGPLDRCAGDQTSTALAKMYQPNVIQWGLVHSPLGQCDVAVSPNGGVMVSNIGSSGQDGVSIDLARAEGCTVLWKPHTMMPGASLRVEARGTIQTLPTHGWLGQATLSCGGTPVSSFFDITYDLTAGGHNESLIQVLDNGVVVSAVPAASATGSIHLEALSGSSLPQLRSCGNQPAPGGAPGYGFVFGGRCLVSLPGSPPVEGDQVRVLCPRLRVASLSRLSCSFTHGGAWEIERSSLAFHGRSLSGVGACALASGSGTTRTKRPGGRIVISNLGSSGEDGVIVSPRDSSSGLPTGQRMKKPMTVSFSGGDLSTPGSALRIGSTGTVSGAPDSPVCRVSLEHATATSLFTSVQYPFELKASIHQNPLYQEAGNNGVNPLFEGVISNASPILIDAAQPVIVSACGASPGDAGRPPHLRCTFARPVTFTLPGGGTVTGREITFVPQLPPGTVVEDLQQLSIQGTRLQSLAIEEISTGPTPKDGLSHTSVGACDLVTNPAGDLVVSNIGSSGQDGVEVALHRAQGVVMEVAGATLPPGSELRLGTRPISDLDRDSYPDLVIGVPVAAAGGGHGGALFLRVEKDAQPRRVRCWDGQCQMVGEFVLPPDDLGTCSPDSSPMELSAFGFNPQEVTSAGVVKPGPFLTFAAPVLFQPSSGGSPVACRTLTISCTDSDSSTGHYRDEPYAFVCRASSMTELRIVRCSCSHLRGTQSGHGGALLMADTTPDRVIVSNIGSSGQDGVSIAAGSACGNGLLADSTSLSFSKIALMPNDPTTPANNPAHLAIEAFGNRSATLRQSLGTCRLNLQSQGGEIPIHADFSELSSPNTRIIVCHDGITVGEFTAPAGGARVAAISDSTGLGATLTGCGRRRPEPLPGGTRPGCYYFHFGSPLSVASPVSSDVFIGDEVRIAPASSTDTITGIRNLVLVAGGIEQLTLTGLPRKDMLQWLADRFTETEINAAAAVSFGGDLDGDGTSDLEEFVRGTDPRTPESGAARRSPSGSIQTGADGLPHFRFSHVLADIEDVTSAPESTSNFVTWDSSPSQFRLLQVSPLPDGAKEYVWEVASPIGNGSPARQFYRGHVTVLK